MHPWKRNKSGGFQHGWESMTRGHPERERGRERDGASDMKRKKWGRAKHRERNRHQIHCFHCLIRSTERERMEGWGSGGREEKRGATWDGLREIHTHSCPTLKSDTENDVIWGESLFFVVGLFKSSGWSSEPLTANFHNFSIKVYTNNAIKTTLELLLFQPSSYHLRQIILVDFKCSSGKTRIFCYILCQHERFDTSLWKWRFSQGTRWDCRADEPRTSQYYWIVFAMWGRALIIWNFTWIPPSNAALTVDGHQCLSCWILGLDTKTFSCY